MNNDLFLALETGNVGTLENFRQQFFNVLGDVTFQGDTPLHIAARKGHVDLVTWIFQLKPSLAEAVNKDNNTPLHEAAKSGNRELVRILLRGQNYVYCFNKFGETALMIASRYRHVEIVRILLQARSYADAFEWDKCLGEAAYKGYNDVLVALLEQVPARPNLRVPVAPILHTAVRGGHLQIVQAMLEHASWENKLMIEEDELGRCAIHVAAVKGNWDIINEFISRMPDCVEIRSSNNKSVLHFAVEHNQLKVVKNLLKNNGNEKVVELVSRDHDISRNMSLHFAAKNAVDPQEDAGNMKRKSKPIRDKDTISTQMLVASLIATVTFAAMFQIPGGIEEDENSIHYGATEFALSKVFRWFMFSDTVAFTTSITVLVGWIVREQLQGRYSRSSVITMLLHFSEVNLLVSIICTVVTFVSATIIIIKPINLESLRSKDKEAFLNYETFSRYELFLSTGTPFFVMGVCFIGLEIDRFSKLDRYDIFKMVGGLWISKYLLIELCCFTVVILCFIHF
ncbi:hypothetical protein SUGI_0547600 [Cryptomeria japonica]|nr:hypothetical protein SUGI_0547600 [Cryptomeria japonica]